MRNIPLCIFQTIFFILLYWTTYFILKLKIAFFIVISILVFGEPRLDYSRWLCLKISVYLNRLLLLLCLCDLLRSFYQCNKKWICIIYFFIYLISPVFLSVNAFKIIVYFLYCILSFCSRTLFAMQLWCKMLENRT